MPKGDRWCRCAIGASADRWAVRRRRRVGFAPQATDTITVYHHVGEGQTFGTLTYYDRIGTPASGFITTSLQWTTEDQISTLILNYEMRGPSGAIDCEDHEVVFDYALPNLHEVAVTGYTRVDFVAHFHGPRRYQINDVHWPAKAKLRPGRIQVVSNTKRAEDNEVEQATGTFTTYAR